MIKSFAHFFSTLFHPLLMVTYGMLIALNFTLLKYVFFMQKIVLVGGAFFFSALMPALLIGSMVWKKRISDYDVDKKEERFFPYLIMLAVLAATFVFFMLASAPYWLLGVIAGSFVALCVAMAINKYWKISAHGIGIGGITGAIFSIAPLLDINPLYLFIPALLASGLVCSSRIVLNKHTLGQVAGGFLLGFCLSAAGVFTSYKLFYNT